MRGPRPAQLGGRGEQVIDLAQAILDRDHLETPLLEQILAEPVAAVHLEHQPAQVADALVAGARERTSLAAQRTGVGAGVRGDSAVALVLAQEASEQACHRGGECS